MSIGKEWKRNPEGGNHVTQIFYISVNSCNPFVPRTEGKREISVGTETSGSV
jgi:hypothetical protein